MKLVGVDEVGRGAWAGPLLVGAVCLASAVEGLDDSKQLSAIRRRKAAYLIRSSGARIGLGWSSPQEVTEHGLAAAMRLAVRRAVACFELSEHQVIIDGSVDYVQVANSTAVVGADSTVAAVSAASIVAKVARDNFMKKMHLIYPGYGFEHNVGYGTERHRRGLERHGPCSIHRMNYRPVQHYEYIQRPKGRNHRS